MKMNVVADALSRNPTLSLMKYPADWKSQLTIEYSKNKLSCELLYGLIHEDAYKVLNDFIYYKDQIFSMLESVLKGKILEVSHDEPCCWKYSANAYKGCFHSLKDSKLEQNIYRKKKNSLGLTKALQLTSLLTFLQDLKV